jgi:hypothetical protein
MYFDENMIKSSTEKSETVGDTKTSTCVKELNGGGFVITKHIYKKVDKEYGPDWRLESSSAKACDCLPNDEEKLVNIDKLTQLANAIKGM